MLTTDDKTKASTLVSSWARGRSQFTPWAPPRLRALAAIRFAVSVFLIGLSAVMFVRGLSALAAVPLAGAILVFSIASLDFAAYRSSHARN